MALHLLHGTLYCTIFGAEHLVNEFRFTGKAPTFFRQVVGVVEQTIHVGRGPSRLYATVDLGTARVGRTRMVEGEPVHPVWNESFRIYCAHYASAIVISIKDDDTVGSHVVGRAHVPVQDVLRRGMVEGIYELYNDDGTLVRGGGRIRVSLEFTPVRGHAHTEGWILQPSFFHPNSRCQVKLYQDAHMREGFMPKIYLQGGEFLEPTRCWEDVYAAIEAAKVFIYIAGWSVFTQISLLRQKGAGEEEKLGDLLKRKAADGVAVLLLVWDDRTSVSYLRPQGVMGTHDEETLAFFRNSKVKCLLCPRSPDSSLSVIQGFQLSTMFTHHQKLISLDAPCAPPSVARKVISFIGGLDLCNGRFDDQRHSLFRTLNAEHTEDFYQGSLRSASIAMGGPRQPWHDIHCRLDGPIAWDVVFNFEQRWRKQGVEGALLDLTEHPTLLPPNASAIDEPESSPDSWTAQLFRSIDGGAAFGFPDNPADAAKMGLVSGKDHVIERSIQDAYIHAIRQAEKFIYIENQYFLGSCHVWDTMTDAGCLHLIPVEIVLKIVSKIEAGERFVAYIVIPMWPEGIPDSNAVQAILEWQRKTMEMMYRQIAIALRAAGKTDEKPTDYLSFFCLGNRESKGSNEVPSQQTPTDPHYKLAQESRRFMIYVHSKLMIVDDEFIILGSANINQRSMDGGRDTEIAVGAYQPYHSWRNGTPHGQIHGFRMSLWYEHLGRLDNLFLKPWSLECVRHVNEAASELWDLFIGLEPVDLPGHLLPYPVVVAYDGTISELPGQPYFPDTKASILGRQTPLPPILTT